MATEMAIDWEAVRGWLKMLRGRKGFDWDTINRLMDICDRKANEKERAA